MSKHRHVGNGVTIHLTSCTLNVETGDVVDLDDVDAAQIAGHPEWVAVKETKPAKTEKEESER